MNLPTHTDGCGSDVAAYALGALPEEERQRFEQHLDTCELCRADLAGLKPVVDALPASVDSLQPPPALRKRIMSVVEAEARERTAEKRRPAPERRSWFAWRPVPALAVACLFLLVGVGIGVGVLNDGTTSYDGDCIRGCSEVAMAVDEGHGTLRVEGMPQPPEGRVYQVWTQRFGEDPRPTDALFTVDKDGSASVDVPGDTKDVDQVLVTDEPRGGSVAPTTAPYFSVKMS